jgi:hypothetical protein
VSRWSKRDRLLDHFVGAGEKRRTSGSQILCISRSDFSDLAASVLSYDVDHGNRVPLLVKSAARIVGRLFPVGADRIAFDGPRSMQHAALSGLVDGGTIGAVVLHAFTLPSRRPCPAF